MSIFNSSKRLFHRTNTVIVGAKRTAIGSFMGAFKDLSATHLGTIAAKAALASCNVDAKDVQEVYMGQVLQAGAGQAPDRQVVLGAGCQNDTPSTLINKVCASGMKSVMMASQAIELGQRDIMLAGGMECMSKAPHLQYLRVPTGFGHVQVLDSIMSDGLTDIYNQIQMGSCAEKFISELGITRQAQDEFAIQSYTRARAAQESGLFDSEIVEVIQSTKKGEIKFKLDEECTKFMPDKFPGLKPAFAKNGTITPANASKLNDGACVFVLMSEKAAKDRGLKPLARIVAYQDASVAPIDFGLAPSLAVQKLFKRTGLTSSNIDYHEINEAFSAVALANMKLLDLDHARVNVNGGAVALGHPLGASGARIILSLMSVLKQKNGSLGMASICNGGGGASVIVIERMN